mmetsp:Transcript_4971/g.13394  ORF Transcript_4971/g.13394 Transcript_4971/m.13394 type:complete len:86 (-) Transcript_4971:2756-3013(-)
MLGRWRVALEVADAGWELTRQEIACTSFVDDADVDMETRDATEAAGVIVGVINCDIGGVMAADTARRGAVWPSNPPLSDALILRM